MRKKNQVSINYVMLVGGVIVLAAAVYFIGSGLLHRGRNTSEETVLKAFETARVQTQLASSPFIQDWKYLVPMKIGFKASLSTTVKPLDGKEFIGLVDKHVEFEKGSVKNASRELRITRGVQIVPMQVYNETYDSEGNLLGANLLFTVKESQLEDDFYLYFGNPDAEKPEYEGPIGFEIIENPGGGRSVSVENKNMDYEIFFNSTKDNPENLPDIVDTFEINGNNIFSPIPIQDFFAQGIQLRIMDHVGTQFVPEKASRIYFLEQGPIRTKVAMEYRGAKDFNRYLNVTQIITTYAHTHRIDVAYIIDDMAAPEEGLVQLMPTVTLLSNYSVENIHGVVRTLNASLAVIDPGDGEKPEIFVTSLGPDYWIDITYDSPHEYGMGFKIYATPYWDGVSSLGPGKNAGVHPENDVDVGGGFYSGDQYINTIWQEPPGTIVDIIQPGDIVFYSLYPHPYIGLNESWKYTAFEAQRFPNWTMSGDYELSLEIR